MKKSLTTSGLALTLALLSSCTVSTVGYSPGTTQYFAAYYPGSPYWNSTNFYSTYYGNMPYWGDSWGFGNQGLYRRGWRGGSWYGTGYRRW